MLIEGWTLLESLYMVIITLFTIGFREVNPLTHAGMVFTMLIAVVGVGTAVYVGGLFVEIIVEGEILGYRRRRTMERRIESLKNHFIICGYGRTGRQIAKEFDADNIAYVVIDRHEASAELLQAAHTPHIIGDVVSDDNLVAAGIERARGLICATDSDVANVYVTLSARALNPTLLIIARASDHDAENKIKMAGADRVISPYYISGKRMAAWASKPVASHFLDLVMHEDFDGLRLTEIALPENSALVSHTIGSAQLRNRTGAHILGIRRADQKFEVQPGPDTLLQPGDIIIALGTNDQLTTLRTALT